MVLPIGPWGGGAATFYQITNSLLFRGGQKLYKSFTSSSTWGLSVWVRRNALGAVNPILGSAVKFNASDTLTAGSLTTTAVYRDPTAWMHIAIAGGRLWVNGIDMGATTTSAFTCSATNCLGYDGTNYLNAEIAEFAFIDGGQTSSSPGYFDSITGSWVPNSVSATWGTNGAYLGAPWNSSSVGTDASGQGNNWTPSGFSSSDVLLDSPTNVYAIQNLLDCKASAALSSGNLTTTNVSGISGGSSGTLAFDISTSSLEWQVTINSGTFIGVGIIPVSETSGNSSANPLGQRFYYGNTGQTFIGTSNTVYGASFGSGDKIKVRINSGSVNFYKWSGSSWTDQGVAWSSLTGIWRPWLTHSGISSATADYGQVAFSPTTGFKSLCTSNLPATTGNTSGSFTGNASSDGPFIYTGAVPLTITINGNLVTWGTHADKLATGFKLRTSSTSYNSTSTNNWNATYSTPQKPTVGSNKVPSNAQGNP